MSISKPLGAPDGSAVNEVRLVGRVSQDPQRRELPSGDELWSFRVVVDRPAPPRRPRTGVGATARGGATVDAVECAAWTARTRRSVCTWRSGDVVAVSGALRRRFYRGPAGTMSIVEVEVAQVRLIRRAANA